MDAAASPVDHNIRYCGWTSLWTMTHSLIQYNISAVDKSNRMNAMVHYYQHIPNSAGAAAAYCNIYCHDNAEATTTTTGITSPPRSYYNYCDILLFRSCRGYHAPTLVDAKHVQLTREVCFNCAHHTTKP
jgi:hypothetical protein